MAGDLTSQQVAHQTSWEIVVDVLRFSDSGYNLKSGTKRTGTKKNKDLPVAAGQECQKTVLPRLCSYDLYVYLLHIYIFGQICLHVCVHWTVSVCINLPSVLCMSVFTCYAVLCSICCYYLSVMFVNCSVCLCVCVCQPAVFSVYE